jgi:OOP family OmpA-OmpF porin
MRIKTLVALASLAVAGVSYQAQAAGGWYVAPSAIYVVNDDDRDQDSGWGVGLAVGTALNDAWNLELSGRYLRLDGKHDEMGSVGVDGLRFFNRDPAFAPYVVMGLGYAKEGAVSGSSNGNLMVNVGAGFFKKMSEGVELRADARYHLHNNHEEAMTTGNLGDWLVSVGVNIALDK